MPAVSHSLKQLVLIKRVRFKENVVYHLKYVQISKNESLSSASGSWRWSEILCVCEFLSTGDLGEIIPLLSHSLLLPPSNLAVRCVSGT